MRGSQQLLCMAALLFVPGSLDGVEQCSLRRTISAEAADSTHEFSLPPPLPLSVEPQGSIPYPPDAEAELWLVAPCELDPGAIVRCSDSNGGAPLKLVSFWPLCSWSHPEPFYPLQGCLLELVDSIFKGTLSPEARVEVIVRRRMRTHGGTAWERWEDYEALAWEVEPPLVTMGRRWSYSFWYDRDRRWARCRNAVTESLLTQELGVEVDGRVRRGKGWYCSDKDPCKRIRADDEGGWLPRCLRSGVHLIECEMGEWDLGRSCGIETNGGGSFVWCCSVEAGKRINLVVDASRVEMPAHELGHSFQLCHSGDPWNLMVGSASGMNLRPEQVEAARTCESSLLGGSGMAPSGLGDCSAECRDYSLSAHSTFGAPGLQEWLECQDCPVSQLFPYRGELYADGLDTSVLASAAVFGSPTPQQRIFLECLGGEGPGLFVPQEWRRDERAGRGPWRVYAKARGVGTLWSGSEG